MLRSVWPDEECLENNGIGWAGTIMSVGHSSRLAGSAMVQLDWRDAAGNRPRATRLLLEVLKIY